MTALCLCGSGELSEHCCAPYLNGALAAPTPLALMRSRYVAYAQCNIDYLLHTWHPALCSAALEQAINDGFQNTHWQDLTIIAHSEDTQGQEGMVEFIARYQEEGDPKIHCLHERSRFIRYDGRWVYVDGLTPKVKRNDPCPCGSGQKYKKCCGQG